MIIQIFGGIAMQSKASRKHCLLHIKRALKEHGKTIVVVSAMGRVGDAYATDTLLDITDALSTSPKAKDCCLRGKAFSYLAIGLYRCKTSPQHQELFPHPEFYLQ